MFLSALLCSTEFRWLECRKLYAFKKRWKGTWYSLLTYCHFWNWMRYNEIWWAGLRLSQVPGRFCYEKICCYFGILEFRYCIFFYYDSKDLLFPTHENNLLCQLHFPLSFWCNTLCQSQLINSSRELCAQRH